MFRETSRLSRGTRTLTWLAAVGGVLGSVEGLAEPVDFSRDIQPLLAKRCF